MVHGGQPIPLLDSVIMTVLFFRRKYSLRVGQRIDDLAALSL